MCDFENDLIYIRDIDKIFNLKNVSSIDKSLEQLNSPKLDLPKRQRKDFNIGIELEYISKLLNNHIIKENELLIKEIKQRWELLKYKINEIQIISKLQEEIIKYAENEHLNCYNDSLAAYNENELVIKRLRQYGRTKGSIYTEAMEQRKHLWSLVKSRNTAYNYSTDPKGWIKAKLATKSVRDELRYHGIVLLPEKMRLAGLFPYSESVQVDSTSLLDVTILTQKAYQLVSKLGLYCGALLPKRFKGGCVCIMFIKEELPNKTLYRPAFGISKSDIASMEIERGKILPVASTEKKASEVYDYVHMGFFKKCIKPGVPKSDMLQYLRTLKDLGINQPSIQSCNYFLQSKDDGLESWAPTNCAEPAIMVAIHQLFPKTIDISLSVPFEASLIDDKIVGKPTCTRCAVSEPAFVHSCMINKIIHPQGVLEPKGATSNTQRDQHPDSTQYYFNMQIPNKDIVPLLIKVERYNKAGGSLTDFSKKRVEFK